MEFSVPTKEYPIPQVTVSAYFTVDVSLLLSIPIYVSRDNAYIIINTFIIVFFFFN